MKVTIKEIAKRSGVSRSTVSRVISNHPNVDEETRQKVKKVMEELNYRPSRLAQGLVKGKINVVGLIIGDIRNPFYSELTRAIEDILNAEGYMVVLCDSDYNPQKEELYLRTAEELGFAGVIMTSAMETKELLQTLQSLSCPVVLLNRYLRAFETDVVSFDNYNGGYIAAEHLIKLGHRRIAILAGPNNSTSSKDRLRGYSDALRDYGLEYKEGEVTYGDLRWATGYEFGLHLLRRQERPTAVFAGNDLMALGIIQAYLDNGLKVPDDLSVVGFDDIPAAYMGAVKLTTVRQPQYEMGVEAAKLMLERIKGIPHAPKRIIFDAKLVIRESTKPII